MKVAVNSEGSELYLEYNLKFNLGIVMAVAA